MRELRPGIDYLTEGNAGIRYNRRRAQEAKELSKPKKIKTLAAVLEDFHNRAKDQTKRLGLLRYMTTIILKEVSLEELTRKRKKFDEFKNDIFPLTEDWCWLCNKQLATIRHHVILLRNGGPELAKPNVVLLCQNCHNVIHPWLHESNVSQSELTRIIDVFQKAKEGKLSRSQAEIEMSIIFDGLFAI